MKAGFPGLCCLLLIFMALASCNKQDSGPDDPEPQDTLGTLSQIPDGEFEEWEATEQGQVRYLEPKGGWWGSLNPLALLGGPQTCLKDSFGNGQGNCLLLMTMEWGSLSIPGLLAAGYFDSSVPIGQNLIQGRPFEGKPIALEALIRYQPAGVDTAAISLALTHWDSLSSRRDTLASASFSTSAFMADFEAISLPIQNLAEGEADSIHLVLISSLGGSHFSGNPGSRFWVDKLRLVYPARSKENHIKSARR